ncbi:MAG: ribonuclease E/G, partial [Hyphomicrobiaceae bacterium]
VNSGKATREFSIEDTALGTNLEAAEEIARQLKLRDLAGLIVIDFIDMEEKRNNRAVERRLKDCLRNDRARIQVGRISHFGLLEMSRQRLRTGVLEGSTSQCPHCQGSGIVRSTESIALAVLRGLDEQLIGGTRGAPLIATTTAAVALYVLNNKRSYINELEVQNDAAIVIQASDKLHGANFVIEKAPRPQPLPKRIERTAVNMDWGFQNEVSPAAPNGEPEAAAFADGEADPRRTRRLRRRRGGREDGFETAGELAPYRDEPPVEEIRNESADVAAPRATVADTAVDAAPDGHAPQDDADRDGASDAARRGRRRGQRGGRRRDRETQVAGEGEQPAMIDIVERSSDRAAGEPQPDLFIPSQAERQPEKQAERQVEAIVTADTRPLEPAPANPEPTDASVAPPPVPVELPPSRRIVPTAGEPVLERVVVGPDVAANSETPPPVDPPPARRKGWWLRRSSDA